MHVLCVICVRYVCVLVPLQNNGYDEKGCVSFRKYKRVVSANMVYVMKDDYKRFFVSRIILLNAHGSQNL